METVASHTPDDGRGIYIFVGDLTSQQFPEHHTKRPGDEGNITWEVLPPENLLLQTHLTCTPSLGAASLPASLPVLATCYSQS